MAEIVEQNVANFDIHWYRACSVHPWSYQKWQTWDIKDYNNWLRIVLKIAKNGKKHLARNCQLWHMNIARIKGWNYPWPTGVPDVHYGAARNLEFFRVPRFDTH